MEDIIIKDRKKYYELSRMVDVFNSFYSLSKIGETSIFDYNGKDLIAITVSAVFSIEVCFKFLYYLFNDKKQKRIHEIKKLYSSIKDYGLEDFLLTGFTIDEINMVLNQINTAFEDFRYLYEYESKLSITPSLLRDFIFNINNYCNLLYKDNVKKQFD